MKLSPVLAAFAMIVLGGAPLFAAAAPGDIFVPAHRTRDGSFVPANVPPLSGGTHLARRPGHGAKGVRAIRSQHAPLAPPLLVEARPLRR